MSASTPPQTVTCGVGGCRGVPLLVRLSASATDPFCIVHTHGVAVRDQALAELAAGGNLWFVRGVPFTSQTLQFEEGRPPRTLFQAILETAPRDSENRPLLLSADFRGATFQGDADFIGVIFQGATDFRGATFQGATDFRGATFHGATDFHAATFQGDAYFSGATFQGDADIRGAIFRSDADFSGATFQGDAYFSGNSYVNRATFRGNAYFGRATFRGDAYFSGATFRGVAYFSGATFRGAANFDRATCQGEADFSGTTFQGDINFHRATFQGPTDFTDVVFEQARLFGPVLVRWSLSLAGALFKQGAEIAVSAETIDARRLRLVGGGHLRLRAVSVDLDDAGVLGPAILAGQPPGSDLADVETDAAGQAEEEPWVSRSGLPRVLSVRRADVGMLTLAAVDLGDCRFVEPTAWTSCELKGMSASTPHPTPGGTGSGPAAG